MIRFCLVFSLLLPMMAVTQVNDKRKLIIAHRGDHTEAPENTLKAFDDAIAQELDCVEMDLRMTKDNQLVIMHDATIDRMTTGTGKIKDLSLDEILSYKVLDKNRPQLGEHKIPLLSEALNICKGRIKIYLDFKEADVEATWKLIRFKGMEKSFVIYINYKDQYKSWRAIAPQVPLMVSLPDSVKSAKSLDSFLKIVDAEILDGDYSSYSIEMVKLAALRNRQVWLDFQQPNEGPAHWEIGTRLGIQGFQSDKPRELKAWFLTQKEN
jgi:glycerophosphoryl diester phosphodiesterase